MCDKENFDKKKSALDEKLINKAKRFCAYRERSTHNVINKLKEWGVDEKTSQKIMQTLIEDNYIDNSRYLKIYVHSKFNIKKWGKNKIKHHLFNEGFSVNEIVPHLHTLDMQYDEVLQKVIEIKLRMLKNEKKPLILRQKIINHCLSKGFEYEAISKIIKKNNL